MPAVASARIIVCTWRSSVLRRSASPPGTASCSPESTGLALLARKVLVRVRVRVVGHALLHVPEHLVVGDALAEYPRVGPGVDHVADEIRPGAAGLGVAAG